MNLNMVQKDFLLTYAPKNNGLILKLKPFSLFLTQLLEKEDHVIKTHKYSGTTL